METESELAELDQGTPAVSTIRWPPPGLERLQGDLGRVAGRAALSGGILVLPLLFVVARDLEFATLGPFADAWWVTVVLAVVGLTFAVDALLRTVRLLRRSSHAVEQGYDMETVANVLADSARDTGFLLTGGRHFSVLDRREREAIGTIRIFSKMMYAIAGVWLPNALAIGLLLGARGLLSPAGLWMGTLLPSITLYVFGAVAGTVEESRVRRARHKWYQQAWAEDLTSDEARQWRSDFASHSAAPGRPSAAPGLARMLRRSAVLVAVLAAIVALPILTLIPTSAVGPVLTMMAVPGSQAIRGRAARAEALRSYAVPVGPGISAAEAGRLLHVMLYVGSDRDAPLGVRAPSVRIDRPWVPETAGANPMGVDVFSWSDSLLQVVAGGISGEQRAYLERIADHPARADFSRLATASAIDVAGGRYEDPLPEEITLGTMPLPQLAGLRMGAYTHLGAAAWDLVNNRPDGAERKIAEVISIGLLLGDGGPTLIDNASGYALVDAGARALASLYDVTGQEARGVELRNLREAAERAATRTGSDVPQGVEAWVRSLPVVVTDPSLARGLRWEYFIGVTTLTPCINLHRMVFGPDEEYRDFVERAHESLVLWPSEEGLFEMARHGWFGSTSTETTLLGRLLGVSMRRGESACGEIVRSLETARAMF